MIRSRLFAPVLFATLLLGTAATFSIPSALKAQEPAKPPASPSPTAASSTPSATAAPSPTAPADGPAPKIELTLPTVGGPMSTRPKVKEPAADDIVGQLLFSTGIDEALLGKFQDGRPLDAGERSPLVGLLSAIRPFKPAEIDEVVQVAAQPSAFADSKARGKFWRAAGRMKSITIEEFGAAELDHVYAEVTDMPEKDLRRFFFRSEVVQGDRPLTVVSLRMPEMLLAKYRNVAEQPLKAGDVLKVDENVTVSGLYIKNLGPDPAAPATPAANERPVLVAMRPAWHPDTPLGKLGMDYGLYDDARLISTDMAHERECFFQLLAAMKRAKWDDLLGETSENYSVVPLFNDPKSMRGKLTALRGIARRATLVNVPYPDIRRRFGISKYYEVAIFTADSRDNPILFDLLELPPGFPEGDDIHVEVRIPGTFLTGFVYERDATSKEQDQGVKPGAQKAPLLIGKELYRYVDKTAAGGTFDWYVSALVGVGAIALGIVGWLTMRGDKKTRKIMEKTNTPETSLNELKGDFKSGPDFSNLE